MSASPKLHGILWRNQGQTLTPELIVGILQGAAFEPDCAVDLSPVRPGSHRDYIFAAERYITCLPELKPMHEMHWQETEGYRRLLPFNPNYERFMDTERRGRLLLFTIRHEGVLVGHATIYLYDSMHTQRLTADEDTLFVVPEHRGGWMAVYFVKWVVEQLKALGVREITTTSKHANNAAVLMQRAGFTPFATKMAMVIGDDDVR